MSGAPVHFASAPIAIDRHEWRVIVTDSAFGGRRFAYQFRAIGELPLWQEQHQWPRFDFEAQSMGLPRRLARLYEANIVGIRAAMHPLEDPIADLLSA